MTENHDAVTEYVTVWKDHEPTKLRWGMPVVRCRDCEHFKRTPPRRVRPDALRMREFVDAHRQGRTWKELREMLAHEGMYYKDAKTLCNAYCNVSKRHDTVRCMKFGTNDPDGFCSWGSRRDI